MSSALTKRSVMMTAQRPSDYVEMRRCAVAFHELGWSSLILFFGQDTPKAEAQPIQTDLEELQRSGIVSRYEFVGATTTVTVQQQVAIKIVHERSALHRFLRLFVTKEERRETIRQLVKRLPKDHITHRVLQGYAQAYKYVVESYYKSSFYNLIYQIKGGARIVSYYLRDEEQIHQIISRLKPDAIILPEDVVGLITPLVIKSGHRQNIPSIIVPYTIANQQEAFLSLQTNPSYHRTQWANRIAGLLFPRWRMTQDGVSLVRLPAPYILGHEFTRTSPPDPWMMNSGFANAVAVENEAMLEYYVNAGLPLSKMRVSGAIYDDYLASYRLDKVSQLAVLRKELGIDNNKPILLIGGCPDQSASCPPGFEFADMDDAVNWLSTALKILDDSYEIIVRPHPNYPRMAEIMAVRGIRTTMIDTARLVALSDIYIAFGSATIRWAISCSVPTINYDLFHYDYSDYKNVGGVINLASYQEFCEVVSGLMSAELLGRLAGEIAISSRRWGRLDGKSAERIATLIDSLCSLEKVPRTGS